MKKNESQELELTSDHEKADSKLLVYASHEIHEYNTVYRNYLPKYRCGYALLLPSLQLIRRMQRIVVQNWIC